MAAAPEPPEWTKAFRDKARPRVPLYSGHPKVSSAVLPILPQMFPLLLPAKQIVNRMGEFPWPRQSIREMQEWVQSAGVQLGQGTYEAYERGQSEIEDMANRIQNLQEKGSEITRVVQSEAELCARKGQKQLGQWWQALSALSQQEPEAWVQGASLSDSVIWAYRRQVPWYQWVNDVRDIIQLVAAILGGAAGLLIILCVLYLGSHQA